MKNLKSLVAIFIMCGVIISCKKDTTQSPTPASGGGATVTNSTISNGFPVGSSNSISGVLKADYVFKTINNSGATSSDAALYNTPLPFWVGYMYSQVGTLSNDVGTLQLNTVTLKKQYTSGSSTLIYTDTASTPNYPTNVTWALNSTGAFPSFTTTVTRGFPVCSSNTFIPTTVSLSAGITINLPSGGITNADSITVFIVGQTASIVNKSFAGSISSLQITPAELSAFSTANPNGAIHVYAKNYSNETISSKTLIYVMQKTWMTAITFIP